MTEPKRKPARKSPKAKTQSASSIRDGGTRLAIPNSGLEVWLYDDANVPVVVLLPILETMRPLCGRRALGGGTAGRVCSLHSPPRPTAISFDRSAVESPGGATQLLSIEMFRAYGAPGPFTIFPRLTPWAQILLRHRRFGESDS